MKSGKQDHDAERGQVFVDAEGAEVWKSGITTRSQLTELQVHPPPVPYLPLRPNCLSCHAALPVLAFSFSLPPLVRPRERERAKGVGERQRLSQTCTFLSSDQHLLFIHAGEISDLVLINSHILVQEYSNSCHLAWHHITAHSTRFTSTSAAEVICYLHIIMGCRCRERNFTDVFLW